MNIRRFDIASLFVLVLAAMGCSTDGTQVQVQSANQATCQEVTGHVDSCLRAYCDGGGDPRICGDVTRQKSLLGGGGRGCANLSVDALEEVKATSCDALVAGMFDSVSGKADAPCPSYFPWCAAVPVAEGYQIEIVESQSDFLTFEVTIDELVAEQRMAGGVEYQALSIPGQGSWHEVGFPELPVVNVYVGAPMNAASAELVSIKPLDSETFDELLVWPAQPLAKDTVPQPEFVRVDAGYELEGAYPEALHELGDLGIWRNYKAARLELRPLRYYPAAGRLEVIKRFRVTLGFALRDDPGATSGESTVASTYDSQLLNYGTVRVDGGRDDGSARFLFVVADELTGAVAPLVAWKRERGLRPLVLSLSEVVAEPASEPNTDAERIKARLREVYQEQGIEYVLFVGDLEQIPMYEERDSTGERLYGDFYYACLEGDDLFPEVAVGRLVGSHDEIAEQVRKIIAYEQGDRLAPWRQQVLLMAHEQNAPAKYTRCSDTIRQRAYAQPAAFSKAYGADGVSNQTIIEHLERGLGLLNYRGHGDMGYWLGWNGQDFRFDDYDVRNGDKTPVVFSVACLTGQLHQQERTLAEQFMKRAGGGAVAFLAATQPSWTKQNHDFDRLLFQSILDDGVRPIGQVLNAANVALLKLWSDAPNAQENAKMYFWLGDPSLEIDLGRAPAQPLDVGWCNIQYPAKVSDPAHIPETDVYAQVWSEGWTNQPGPAPFLMVQAGYGEPGTHPQTDETWTWNAAYYNEDKGNNDEYMTRLNVAEPGVYAYAFRVSGDGGASWRYCDLDGSDNGLSVDQLGEATIGARPLMDVMDFRLGWPYETSARAGEETPRVNASLTIDAMSWDEALLPFVRAEAGIGPIDTLPEGSADWTWHAAEIATAYSSHISLRSMFTAPETGTYALSYRMTQDGGQTWLYTDHDGYENGVTLEDLGRLVVE